MFGNGEPGMGLIPDWKPIHYDPDDVIVPYFIPDTAAARQDISAQYTTVSRLDQGIGLIMAELNNSGHLMDTLVIYSSDNGIPFPSGRTNLYDPGVLEPMIVSNPLAPQSHGQRSMVLVSLLDLVPTVLDWFQIPYPNYTVPDLGPDPIQLQGNSILSLLSQPELEWPSQVYLSQSLHEATMYYPMRAIRTNKYKLIHNMNAKSPFPIDQDFYLSPTFQDILNRTNHGWDTHWYKELKNYYYRSEWELYDLNADPEEMVNLAKNASYRSVIRELKGHLEQWQWLTNDPWVCSPHGVLEKDAETEKLGCRPLFN